jgi:predicted membrane metal-binding protein
MPKFAIAWFACCVAFWIYAELTNINLPSFIAIVMCVAISYYVSMGFPWEKQT